jgi:hypothetical protein
VISHYWPKTVATKQFSACATCHEPTPGTTKAAWASTPNSPTLATAALATPKVSIPNHADLTQMGLGAWDCAACHLKSTLAVGTLSAYTGSNPDTSLWILKGKATPTSTIAPACVDWHKKLPTTTFAMTINGVSKTTTVCAVCHAKVFYSANPGWSSLKWSDHNSSKSCDGGGSDTSCHKNAAGTGNKNGADKCTSW